MQGRVREAEDLFRRVLRIGQVFDYDYYFSEYLRSFAALLTDAGRFEEAQELNEQALRLAIETERPDIQFEARLLAIRLETLLQTLSNDGARKAFSNLLAVTDDDSEKAAIHYELWRLNPGDEAVARAAQAAADAAFEATAEMRFSRIYTQISGHDLPRPAVPPLPGVIGQGTADMDALLKRLDVLMAAREI
jgi:tetratricopeptide (TPR) repeat protein